MSKTSRPRRSVLYMPGSNTRALEKAKILPADSLILDLEDSVAADSKKDARANVLRSIEEGGYGYRELVVRISTAGEERSCPLRDATIAALHQRSENLHER